MLPQGNGHERVAAQALPVELLLASSVAVSGSPSSSSGISGASLSPARARAVIRFRGRNDLKNHEAFESCKRVFDVLGALFLLVACSPVLLLTAVAVKATSSGPALFRQTRLTLGGKEFFMLKFRTMIQDAERASGPQFAEENDPRVTSLGRFLRKTRIDELPQLFNVIAGDMSLIGPRPERPEMARSLETELPNFSRRLAVKGGITGLAQVTSGYASDVQSYKRKLALDLLYVENRSLRLDLIIAVRTVRVMLTGSGSR